MKNKLLLLLWLIGCTFAARAQQPELPSVSTVEYPRYIFDSAGGKMCVIFTLEQAQKIDNDEDLLAIYRELNRGSDSAIEALIFQVKTADTVITILSKKVDEFKHIIEDYKA